MLEAGRRSSRKPASCISVVRETRRWPRLFPTPQEKVSMCAVSCIPVNRRSFPCTQDALSSQYSNEAASRNTARQSQHRNRHKTSGANRATSGPGRERKGTEGLGDTEGSEEDIEGSEDREGAVWRTSP